MRSIIFRAKPVDPKLHGEDYVFGFYYQATVDTDVGVEHFIKNKSHVGIRIDENTIGQFTGCKDVNKVELYENDYVRYHNREGQVEYDEDMCAFFVYSDHDSFFMYFDKLIISEIEVIKKENQSV